jgi:hypothetical protein
LAGITASAIANILAGYIVFNTSRASATILRPFVFFIAVANSGGIDFLGKKYALLLAR